MPKSPNNNDEKERLIEHNQPKKYNSAEESIEKEKDQSSNLIVAFILMLIFQLGNRIFGRLQTFPMHNYPMFMNICSTIIYIPLSFAYIIPVMKYTNWIGKEQTEIPKYKFGIMGMWDSVAGIMQTFAVNYISNSSMIVLVQQSAIPISMAISKITLGAKYTKAQYVGAGVVLLGIIVVLIPTLFGASSSSSSPSASGSTTELLWILVLVISCVPMCFSSVYKEKALGETEIDVIYLNGWVAIFQFAFSIPLCIPSAMAINVPMDEIWPNLVGGMKCWMGVNSLPTDDCAMAPFFVTTYLAFNVIYNVLIIVILKHGSANILWMASTVIVPLSNVAFSLKCMPGSKPLTFWDMLGLFVIMFGLLIYRFMIQLFQAWNYVLRKLSLKNEPLDEREDEAKELQRTARLVGKKAESKQVKFVGRDQIEGIQSLIDTRVMREQKQALFRSPQQIRSSLLVRLGIPPSPLISMGRSPSALGDDRRSTLGSGESGRIAPFLSPIRTRGPKEGGVSLQPLPNIPPRVTSPVVQSITTTNNNNSNNRNTGLAKANSNVRRAAEV